MKCLFAIVFISIVLVEWIHAAPKSLDSWKQGTNNLEPAFSDDTASVLTENKDYKRYERYCKGERGSCWTTKDCCDDFGCLPPISPMADGTCVKKTDYPNRKFK